MNRSALMVQLALNKAQGKKIQEFKSSNMSKRYRKREVDPDFEYDQTENFSSCYTVGLKQQQLLLLSDKGAAALQ